MRGATRGYFRPAGLPDVRTGSPLIQDDFIAGVNGGLAGSLQWTPNAGVLSAQSAVAGHPGVVRHSTSAVINTLAFMRLGDGVLKLDADDLWDLTWIVRLNTNDSDTLMRAGLMSDPVANPPADGVYFEKLAADTSWFGVTRAGAAETRTAALAATSTNWVTLRMRRESATTVKFSVDSGAEVSANATLTGAAMGINTQIRNATAVAKTFDIDAFQMSVSGLSR